MTVEGSGFFISPDGYAVTNNHVVERGGTLEIESSDHATHHAKVVARDVMSDLALLKVDGDGFSYVELADKAPRVGDWVLTVGNPYGLGGTVTAGIVSALERYVGARSPQQLLQIGAPINRGDSGGPSFNSEGEVVGVNTMIYSPSGGSIGIAFAVPAETVRTVIEQLKDKGTVIRGWLGARVRSVTPEIAQQLGLAEAHGAVVREAAADSPAAKAGITGGDVIVSLDGEPVKDAHELTRKIRQMAPGSSVQLGFLRGGQEKIAGLVLGQFHG
jgi:serine protease Do